MWEKEGERAAVCEVLMGMHCEGNAPPRPAGNEEV
jgi:hypothetical protein